MIIPSMDKDQGLGVQVAGSGKLAVEVPDELKGMFNIADNMEGVVPRLPQISIIHRGQLFELPDESKVETFEGIILDQHPANAWWEKEMGDSGGNAVPDCFSMDGKTPGEAENVQCDKCVDCDKNQFGSDSKGSGGKACKNMKRLHVLMEGSLLPRRLTVPPTSIKSFELFMTGLVDRGLHYALCVTTFSLAKKMSDTFEYAEVKFAKGRVLEKREMFSVAGFIRQYKDEARKQAIQEDEYVTKDDEEKPDDAPASDAPDSSGDTLSVPNDDIPF